MYRVLASLVFLLLLACDRTDDLAYAQLDTRLRGMSGASERQLLGAMGRIPDRSFRLDDGTKVLQWRWEASHDGPACTPRRATRGYARDLARDDCVVEWTVARGTSQTWRWQGRACDSATIVSFPVP